METVKPLPVSQIECNVAGVSFHADAVNRAYVTQKLTIVHDPDNPVDSNALRVIDENEDLLGHVPSKFGLTKRILATSQGPWEGEIVEIFEPGPDVMTRSLRIKIFLQKKVTQEIKKPVRYRDTEKIKETKNEVFTVTGRYVGILVKKTATTVTVKADDELRQYPINLVTITQEPKSENITTKI